MPTLTTTPDRYSRELVEELIAAVPALVETLPSGRRSARFEVERTDELVSVTFPDDIDPAAVQAVIDAHVPAPPVAGPDYGADAEPPSRAMVAQVVTQLRGFIALDVQGMTAVQILTALVPVVKTLCRVALLWLRSRFGNGG